MNSSEIGSLEFAAGPVYAAGVPRSLASAARVVPGLPDGSEVRVLPSSFLVSAARVVPGLPDSSQAKIRPL